MSGGIPKTSGWQSCGPQLRGHEPLFVVPGLCTPAAHPLYAQAHLQRPLHQLWAPVLPDVHNAPAPPLFHVDVAGQHGGLGPAQVVTEAWDSLGGGRHIDSPASLARSGSSGGTAEHMRALGPVVLELSGERRPGKSTRWCPTVQQIRELPASAPTAASSSSAPSSRGRQGTARPASRAQSGTASPASSTSATASPRPGLGSAREQAAAEQAAGREDVHMVFSPSVQRARIRGFKPASGSPTTAAMPATAQLGSAQPAGSDSPVVQQQGRGSMLAALEGVLADVSCDVPVFQRRMLWFFAHASSPGAWVLVALLVPGTAAICSAFDPLPLPAGGHGSCAAAAAGHCPHQRSLAHDLRPQRALPAAICSGPGPGARPAYERIWRRPRWQARERYSQPCAQQRAEPGALPQGRAGGVAAGPAQGQERAGSHGT